MSETNPEGTVGPEINIEATLEQIRRYRDAQKGKLIIRKWTLDGKVVYEETFSWEDEKFDPTGRTSELNQTLGLVGEIIYAGVLDPVVAGAIADQLAESIR